MLMEVYQASGLGIGLHIVEGYFLGTIHWVPVRERYAIANK